MKLTVKEIAVFGMLGAFMFASKVVLEFLPNVHLIAMFIVAITVVYRWKALYSILVFILLIGVYYGFPVLWWPAYFYIWPILWGMAMLIPKNLPRVPQMLVYMACAGLHGFLYGTLWAPFQAIAFGLSFNGTVSWIIAGLPWDAIHGASNIVCGLMIYPFVAVMRKLRPTGIEK